MSGENVMPRGIPEERRERSDRSDEGIPLGGDIKQPIRRKWSMEDKLKILEEADRSHLPGQIGYLLRSEGIYSSTLSQWRKWRLKLKNTDGTSDNNRSDLRNENSRLKRKVAKLEMKLKKAESMIELQKKISEMMDKEFQDEQNEKE